MKVSNIFFFFWKNKLIFQISHHLYGPDPNIKTSKIDSTSLFKKHTKENKI